MNTTPGNQKGEGLLLFWDKRHVSDIRTACWIARNREIKTSDAFFSGTKEPGTARMLGEYDVGKLERMMLYHGSGTRGTQPTNRVPGERYQGQLQQTGFTLVPPVII